MTKISLYCSLVLCIAVTSTITFGEEQNRPKAVVLMIDREANGFVYKVDGEKVSKRDLLEALGRKKVPPYPAQAPELVLLVHRDVSIAMIGDAEGIVTKVGYRWPRIFLFDKTKSRMQELKFGNNIPFSSEGPTEQK